MRIFSIGHSNHSIEQFCGLLEQHEVTRVLDVRSRPQSRFHHFNKRALASYLSVRSIGYGHNGMLGGREGLEPRILAAEIEAMVGSIESEERLALMCSEGDPLSCHRSYLIGPVLHEQGVEYVHILRSGELMLYSPGESTSFERHTSEPPTAAKKVTKRARSVPAPQRKLF